MIGNIEPTSDFISRLIEMLGNGGIIALPTDTVYGLACDGLNRKAVEGLVELKGRAYKPFTFFMSKQLIDTYALVVKKKIIEYFMPGPITIVLNRQPAVSLPLVEETVGIRIPQMDFIIRLLNIYEHPLCVTSANRSGEKPLTTAHDIQKEFGDAILVVDGGTLDSPPSTVVDLTTTPVTVRRKGRISILEIEKVYGRPVLLETTLTFNVLLVCSGNTCRSPMAAGILRTLVRDEYCQIQSAGTLSVIGLPASQYSVEVVSEYGGSIDHHMSQPLTRDLITWADLILVMGYAHYNEVLSFDPGAVVKTFLLKEYKRKVKYNEVADPVGKEKSAYVAAAEDMLPSLKLVARDIKKRFRNDSRRVLRTGE